MLRAIRQIDLLLRKTLTAFCAIFLFLMVAFAVYNVVMRYVFEDPPVWGDLLTVLSNIWLVFLALALTVRDKDHIALDLIYSRLTVKAAFFVQQFWSLVIFFLGIVIFYYGLQVYSTMGGKYWEMWYFAWENGGFCLQAQLHAEEVRHCDSPHCRCPDQPRRPDDYLGGFNPLRQRQLHRGWS